MIPVSVVIVTKNESQNIIACLEQLNRFDDVWVVDSASRDGTIDLAKTKNAQVVSYQWNGQYPKKRQWCLENLSLKYDWVFFVDADEMIPNILIDEIEKVILSAPPEAGFFIVGRYRIQGKILQHGSPNQKIALLHRARMEFPVIDDLDIPGMGEIEGHYQPVLKSAYADAPIGSLESHMIHDALNDAKAERAWLFRHEKYARWEAGMNAKQSWPKDPIVWRDKAKAFLRSSYFRPQIVFLVGFVLKLGFLDGAQGLKMSKMRYAYLKKIQNMRF
jgi:glycosyltransferase involved in cell wall biosynthesis